MNDRLVTGRPIDDDLGFELSLRPRRLDEYVGQPQVIANLRVAIEAARARGEALDHHSITATLKTQHRTTGMELMYGSVHSNQKR